MVNIRSRETAADTAAVEAAAKVLTAGGVVGLPTETFYALAVDAAQDDALARLAAMKGRPPDKAVLVLVANVAMVHQVAHRVPPEAAALMAHFWPGPLTLILEARKGLPRVLTAGSGTIGVRQSSHPLALALAARYGRPLTGTSANRAGQPPLLTAEAVAAAFAGEIDLILRGAPCGGGAASTIVDVSRRPPRLVRAGAVPWEAVRLVLGQESIRTSADNKRTGGSDA